jgi:hypothetical protein
VHVVLHLTPAQVRGLRLADNRTNQESDRDFELLVLELSELKGLDFDFSLTGFDPGEIDGFLGLHAGLTDPDEVPHPTWYCVATARHPARCRPCYANVGPITAGTAGD